MRSKNALILFIRNPKLGHVKTRLAQGVGDKKALEIYLQLLTYTRSIIKNQSWINYLFYDQAIVEHDDWPKTYFVKKLQHRGDLGDRLLNALNDVSNVHKNVIMIGSDCGVLTSDIIQEAFESLERFDVVIGPTEDGGYYLVGVNDVYHYLFVDINWSSETVFSETMAKIKAHNLSYHLLITLYDIDYKEDWDRLGWE